jgi:hypothetical protein
MLGGDHLVGMGRVLAAAEVFHLGDAAGVMGPGTT